MTAAAGLERQQRGVLALIKSRTCESGGDPWLEGLAKTPHLEMVREIALWWRNFQIEARCRYTSRALKTAGRYAQAVDEFFSGRPTSPFVEELARAFLAFAENDPDPLVRAVARFEWACLKMGEGATETFRIEWDRDPNQVLRALGERTVIAEPGEAYVMILGNAVPGLVSITAA